MPGSRSSRLPGIVWSEDLTLADLVDLVGDEAVRLAKRYSTDEAGSFVNGILGAVQREREEADG